MFEEEFLPLSPANFFDLKCEMLEIPPDKWREEIMKPRYLLPDTGWLLGEKESPPLHLAWSSEGIYGYLKIEGRFEDPSFPDLSAGDSLELFIDTRDRKDSGSTTRFCHHFYFLPQALEGHIKGECTHFRTEDSHPLANSEEIYLEAQGSAREGKLKFHLPASVLVGWDPFEFKRIGLSYRLNRRWHETAHFSARSEEFALEEQPALWVSCQLR